MIKNLKTVLAIAIGFAIGCSAMAAANAIFAERSTVAAGSSPFSLYSPVSISEQPVKLRTFAADRADSFAATIYGSADAAAGFVVRPTADGSSFARTADQPAALALAAGRESM